MKRSLLALLALCAISSTSFAQNTSGDNLWLYTVDGNGEAKLVGITQYGLDELAKLVNHPEAGFEVPAEVDGYPLTTIGRTAFEKVRWINFGFIDIYSTGATRVEERAFALLRVKNVYFGCETLSIGDFAFEQSEVQNVYLFSPNTQVTIGNYAFWFALGFRGFSTGPGTENLGPIPPGATSIGVNPFWENFYISNEVAIPSGISHISQWFVNCSVQRLIIPDTVTSIAYDAFRDTINSLLFKGSPPAGPFSLAGTIYRLPGASGWSNSFGGVPVEIFLGSATATGMSPASGFQFSWSGTGTFPVNVERAPSPSGPWTVVSSNNTTGQFTDPNPPSGSAFYRAQATIP
jgi:hypothetical protein